MKMHCTSCDWTGDESDCGWDEAPAVDENGYDTEVVWRTCPVCDHVAEEKK